MVEIYMRIRALSLKCSIISGRTVEGSAIVIANERKNAWVTFL